MYRQEVAITRLGLHLNALTDASRRLVLGYPWAVVKVLGIWDEGFLAQLKVQNPKVIIVGRNWYGTQDFNVDAAVAPILGTSPRIRQLVDYWETYNEVLGGDSGNAQRFADFSVATANRLHQAGLKHCALSLAVGTPAGSDDQIKQTLDILWPAVAAADAWSYHAYGAPEVLTDAKWYALRYRHLIELDPRYATKPLILSELGQDYGVIPGQHGGYLAHQVSFADYASQLIAIDSELRKDAYVLGGTIFQAGDATPWNASTDSGQTWGSFCVTDQIAQAIFQGETMPTDTLDTFIAGVLAGIGASGTTAEAMLRAWCAAEGGLGHNNPLNTTLRMPGSTDFNYNNGYPVQSYDSIQTGITATVTTLKNGYYDTIITDLRTGNVAAFPQDVYRSPWGTTQGIQVVLPPSADSAQDPDLAYFGMLGHTPNPDSALWKYALKPLRDFYLQLKAQNHPMADLVNPGPATGPEYTVVVNGVTAYRINLTNRVLETKCVNGVWEVFQAEVLK